MRARENGRKSKAVRTKATTKWMAPNHKVRAAIEWIGEAFCLPWNTVSISPTPLLLPHSSFPSSVSIPFFIYYPEHRFFQHPDTNLIPTKQGPSTSLYIHSQRLSTTIDILHHHLSWDIYTYTFAAINYLRRHNSPHSCFSSSFIADQRNFTEMIPIFIQETIIPLINVFPKPPLFRFWSFLVSSSKL